ncbi:MAG: hypothetical protein RLZZ502_1769, partial [Pseudomonadota bacterium]
MKRATRFVLTPLAVAIYLSQAQAQTAAPAAAPQTPKPTANTETVVVTGFKASLESALNKKKEDNGIVDVIKAEDIGKFPDTNLAESLQRVPGVVIDRDAGEGRSISVRGLGPDFTRVRINGVEAQATTGGTDSSGGNNRSRGFDFNVFASELFNSLTVRKSASADVEEGSLGATVDLQTGRPFDQKGFRGSIAVKESYNDLSKKATPRASFLLSNTSDDGVIGGLISGSFSKRSLYEEGFSTVRWDNGASSGGWCSPVGFATTTTSYGSLAASTGTNTTCGPAAQGVNRIGASAAANTAYIAASDPNNFHPRLPRYGRLTHEQDRTGLTGSFQLRPNADTLLTLDVLYSKLSATRQEDFIEALSFSRTLTAGGKPQTSVLATEYAPNGALLYGSYNGVDLRSESRFDKLTTTFTQPTLSLEQSFGDSWKLNASYGQSISKFRNPIQTTTTLDALNVNGYSIDFRQNDRLPIITYPIDVTALGSMGIVGVPAGATSITNGTASEIRIRPNGTDNRIESLHADVAYEAIPAVLTLKAGIDSKKYEFSTFEYRRTNESIFALPNGTTAASISTTLTGFGNGLSLPAGTPTTWVIPNLNALASLYDIYCNCLKSGSAGGPGDFTLTSITNGNARGNNRSVVEQDTGGFLMADFYDKKLLGIPVRGNIGARYVQTKQWATGYQATAGGTEVTVERKYSDFLPSTNLNFEVSKDFIVRVAAAKVMSRPGLGNLSPGGSISTSGTLSITSGNPNLEPFRATTYDANFEYYMGKGAFIGVGVFQKDINTYIQSLRVNIPYNQTGLPMSLLPSNFNGSEVFQVTTPINTKGGKLTGFEINYQQPFTFLPGFARNFGTVLNYTQVKSKINYLVSPTSDVTITDDLLNLS